MKAQKILLLFTALLCLNSCSSEDDNSSVNSSLVVGEWKMDKLVYSGSSKLTQDGTTYATEYSGEAVDVDFRVTFHDDNTFDAVGSYTVNLVTNFNGEVIEQSVPISSETSGTWELKGDKIITSGMIQTPSQNSGQSNRSEGVIVELSDSKLIISVNQSDKLEIDGLTTEYTTEGVQEFSR